MFSTVFFDREHLQEHFIAPFAEITKETIATCDDSCSRPLYAHQKGTFSPMTSQMIIRYNIPFKLEV